MNKELEEHYDYIERTWGRRPRVVDTAGADVFSYQPGDTLDNVKETPTDYETIPRKWHLTHEGILVQPPADPASTE